MSQQQSQQQHSPGQAPGLNKNYVLTVRQQPENARVAIGKEKDRKPIDPPPIVQLSVNHVVDPHQNFLQSPYLFMTCRLVNPLEGEESPDGHSTRSQPKDSMLTGAVVSSLYSLKDTNNEQGAFFIFGDVSCKCEGVYRLEFNLFQHIPQTEECVLVQQALSRNFTVYAQKFFPGMSESTFMTRSFSDQGVRLRIRKDSRTLSTRKRNSSSANVARQYHELKDRGHLNGMRQSRHNSLSENYHHGAHLERSRDTIGPALGAHGSAAYFDPHQHQHVRDFAHSASVYPYYEDQQSSPRKRRRTEETGNGIQAYNNVYSSPYQEPPRTMSALDLQTLEMQTFNPVATGAFSTASHPAIPPMTTMPSLPSQPSYMSRIDTDSLGGQVGAGPASAGLSDMSPATSTRRSPAGAFQYGTAQQHGIFPSPTTMAFHGSVTATAAPGSLTQQTNGLGIAMSGIPLPSIEVERTERQLQSNGGL